MAEDAMTDTSTSVASSNTTVTPEAYGFEPLAEWLSSYIEQKFSLAIDASSMELIITGLLGVAGLATLGFFSKAVFAAIRWAWNGVRRAVGAFLSKLLGRRSRQNNVFGRDKLKAEVLSLIENKQPSIVWGASGLGKSTLLGLCRDAAHDLGMNAMYCEIDGSKPVEQVMRRVAANVLIRSNEAFSEATLANLSVDALTDRIVAAIESDFDVIFIDGLQNHNQVEALEHVVSRQNHCVIVIGLQTSAVPVIGSFTPKEVEQLDFECAKKVYAYYRSKQAKNRKITLTREQYNLVAGNTLGIQILAGLTAGQVTEFSTGVEIPEGEGRDTDNILFSLYSKLSRRQWLAFEDFIQDVGCLEATDFSAVVFRKLISIPADDLQKVFAPYGVVAVSKEGDVRLHPSFVRWCLEQASLVSTEGRNTVAVRILQRLCTELSPIEGNKQGTPDIAWLPPTTANAEVLSILLQRLIGHPKFFTLWDLLIENFYEDPRGWIREHGFPRQFAGLWGEILDTPAQPTQARARLLKNMGILNYWLGGDEAALSLFFESRNNCEKIGDEVGQIVAQYLIGFISDDQSLYREAESEYRKGYNKALKLKGKDPYLIATGAHLLGCTTYHRGDFEASLQLFQDAEILALENGYKDLANRAQRRQVATLIRLKGDTNLSLAEKRLQDVHQKTKSLARHRDLQRVERLWGQLKLSQAQVEKDAVQRCKLLVDALSFAKKARSGFQESKFARGEGYSERLIGEILLEQGKTQQAQDATHRSLDIARKSKSLFGEAAALRLLSRIDETDDTNGLEHLWNARNIFTVIGHTEAKELETMIKKCPKPLKAPPKPIKAIIFDLMETLAETDNDEYNRAMSAVSESIEVKPDEFREAWRRSRRKASTGQFLDTAGRLEWVANDLNRPLTMSEKERLSGIINKVWLDHVSLYPETKEILRKLRSLGLKIGILSNGPFALTVLKKTLGIQELVDAFLVSCEIGAIKPDPRAYDLMLEKLEVSADETVYVGDGNDRELNGARDVGLYPVKVKTMTGAYADPRNQSTFWNLEIDTLEDIVKYLKRWVT